MIEPLSPVDPPARPLARAGRDVLERVLLRLSQLPAKVDRGPIQAALGAALTALGRLERSGVDDLDHLDLLRGAVAAAARAHGLASSAEATGREPPVLAPTILDVHDALAAVVEPTITLVVERQDHLMRRREGPAPERPATVPFRACAGTPRLFTLEREPLPLLVRSGPPPGADDDAADEQADLDADDTPSAEESDDAEETPARADERTFGSEEALVEPVVDTPSGAPNETAAAGLARLARDVMEEVGSLGMLRSPDGPPVAWGVGLQSFEDRLLRDVDAFMALAEPLEETIEPRFDAIAELTAWAGDAMVPDPVRAFARAFLLGCVSGEDTARAVVIALRQSHPMTHAAQRDALALAPHPGLAPLLERVCAEETPALVRVAVDVLRRRRQASFEAVAPLLSHPAPAVREAAARCLAVATAPEAARQLLEEHTADEEDDAALLAAAEALLVLGSAKGLALVRERLGEEAAFEGSLPKGARLTALRLLGQAGARQDGALLGRLLRADPAAALAIGWHGDAAAVPLLIGQLAEAHGIPARHAFSRALAAALHRITGLGRPPGDEGRTKLFVVEPVLDATFWAAQWEGSHERFAKPVKYRFGRAFSPLAVVTEAETSEVLTDVFRDLLAELHLLSRGASRAEPESWVTERRAALAEMREHFRAAAGRYPEGQWPAGVLFEPSGAA